MARAGIDYTTRFVRPGRTSLRIGAGRIDYTTSTRSSARFILRIGGGPGSFHSPTGGASVGGCSDWRGGIDYTPTHRCVSLSCCGMGRAGSITLGTRRARSRWMAAGPGSITLRTACGPRQPTLRIAAGGSITLHLHASGVMVCLRMAAGRDRFTTRCGYGPAHRCDWRRAGSIHHWRKWTLRARCGLAAGRDRLHY